MPSGHFGHYAMYGHLHFAPWIGPIALVAPLVVLAVFSVVVMGGQRAGRWCDARRNRSRAGARSAGARSLGAKPTPASRPRARALASDLDRDRIVDRLSEAVGEGRLSFEEGADRIDAALRSRHLHELEGLVADLPALDAASGAPVRHPARRRVLAAGAAFVVLAALAVQVSTGLWALWPLAVASVAAASLLSRR
ncbi:MAG: DUF1707 SHOCT-like domain-containing protein [Acidimicrobiales bacterium]